MEPMICKFVKPVIEKTRKYVTDSIWLGKMNDWKRRVNINGVHGIPIEMLSGIEHWENDDNIWTLYYRYKEDPMIKWKESIKKVIGLKMPEEKGLDI